MNSTILSLPDISCMGEDPLFLTYLRLTNANVGTGLVRATTCEHVLPLPHGIGRPVSHAMVVGILVRVDIKGRSTTYTLDDGTGLLDCVLWSDDAIGGLVAAPLVDLNVQMGMYVRAYGRLDFPPAQVKSGRQFMERRQLILDDPLQIVDEFQQVVHHYAKARHLWKTLYMDPTWQPRILYNTNATVNNSTPPPIVPKPLPPPPTLKNTILQVIKTSSIPLLTPSNAQSVHPSFLQTTFDLESLSCHPEIMATKSSPEQVEKLCRTLVREGIMFFSDSVNTNILQLITHDTCIKPAILLALSKFETEHQFSEGMTYVELAEVLKQDVRLRAVSEKTMKDSIRLLIRDSLIYETGDGILKMTEM